jgi:RNA polymerase sigma factor (sigma-70 family)
VRTSQTGPAERLHGVTGTHAPPKAPFDAVVAQYATTVLRVCRAVLGPVDAEDAWSETFLSALKAYPELPAGANVEAWLVTIAHRKAIDVTRATTRHAIPSADLPDTTPAPAADHRDLDLAAAVTRLPMKQRQAVAYHYLAGLPYAEVAVIVGGSAEAARRAASDGVAALRRTYLGAKPEGVWS